MKIVVVRHHVLPDAEHTAIARINTMTERIRAQPGLCFRHVGRELDDPACVVSVTAWSTDADCARWEAVLAASPLPKVDRSSLYRSVEHIVVDAPAGPISAQQVG
ncbi:MAG TPA: antibiotic biosynthesis monooxygenase [Pararobbsia sp.]|jgi:heme-degrading monooxygenase HmoA|nr:antibiotic biosynthesis monooxygenase [Pararobbsia sp.]